MTETQVAAFKVIEGIIRKGRMHPEFIQAFDILSRIFREQLLYEQGKK